MNYDYINILICNQYLNKLLRYDFSILQLNICMLFYIYFFQFYDNECGYEKRKE